MQYTIQKLAQLAGVSSRTLRYYHEIGLLTPLRTSSSGYRIYGPGEVDRLQQILFYRELGVELAAIAKILDAPEFNELDALRKHREELLSRQKRLEQLLENVNATLEAKERGTTMSDNEKFQGFKENLILENENKYGEEIRQKYGEEAVAQSNQRLMDMTQEEYTAMEQLGARLLEMLDEAFESGDPAGKTAQEAADMHRRWLLYSWGEKKYSPEAHLGLAEMYVADERFAAYYDRGTPGKAAFLRDAIKLYTEKQ